MSDWRLVRVGDASIVVEFAQEEGAVFVRGDAAGIEGAAPEGGDGIGGVGGGAS